jgi:hypothetical protein
MRIATMPGETAPSSGLFYHGTKEEVRLGDRVRIRRWLRRPLKGVVSYIPGLSPLHPEIGSDEWAILLPDGSLRCTVYSPRERSTVRPHIEFVARGEPPPALDPKRRLEDWWEPEEGNEEPL